MADAAIGMVLVTGRLILACGKLGVLHVLLHG